MVGDTAPSSSRLPERIPGLAAGDISDEVDEGCSFHPSNDHDSAEEQHRERSESINSFHAKTHISFSETVRITGGVSLPRRKTRSRKPIPLSMGTSTLPSNAIANSPTSSRIFSEADPSDTSCAPSRRPSSSGSGRVFDSTVFSTVPSSDGDSPTVSHPPSLKSASKAQSVVSSAVASRSSSPCSSIMAPLQGSRDKPTRPWFGSPDDDPRIKGGGEGECYHDLVYRQMYKKRKRQREEGYRALLREYGSTRQGPHTKSRHSKRDKEDRSSYWDFLISLFHCLCFPCFGTAMNMEEHEERDPLLGFGTERRSRSVSPLAGRRDSDGGGASSSV